MMEAPEFTDEELSGNAFKHSMKVGGWQRVAERIAFLIYADRVNGLTELGKKALEELLEGVYHGQI